MKYSSPVSTNQDGYVLIVALLMLFVLSAYGIFAMRNSSVELQISGNDRAAKKSLAHADGGAQVGAMLIEDSIACVGFTANYGSDAQIRGSLVTQSALTITDMKTKVTDSLITSNHGYPTDSAAQAYLPYNYSSDDAHTNLYFYSSVEKNSGAGLEQDAGYEGVGTSSANGGVKIVTQIYSKRIGTGNNVAALRSEWTHISGQTASCTQ